MNNNMKKVVASIVLGTFTVGMTTPAYAIENTDMGNTHMSEEIVLNYQNINDMPLIHSDGNIETYGIKGITLKGLKELIETNWTRITTFLIDINVENELIYNLNEMKSTFFMLLDVYFAVSDTANEAIKKSLEGLGLNSTVAAIIADGICLVIF